MADQEQHEHCAHCGADLFAGGERDECWLCRAPLRHSTTSTAPAESEGSRWTVFLIAAAALIVGMGALFAMRGILAIVLIAMLPLAIRAGGRSKSSGKPSGNWLTDFFSALGIMLAIGLAAIGAFFIACFGVCAGLGTAGFFDKKTDYGPVIAISVFAGLVVGILVLIKATKKWWPGR